MEAHPGSGEVLDGDRSGHVQLVVCIRFTLGLNALNEVILCHLEGDQVALLNISAFALHLHLNGFLLGGPHSKGAERDIVLLVGDNIRGHIAIQLIRVGTGQVGVRLEQDNGGQTVIDHGSAAGAKVGAQSIQGFAGDHLLLVPAVFVDYVDNSGVCNTIIAAIGSYFLFGLVKAFQSNDTVPASRVTRCYFLQFISTIVDVISNQLANKI